VLSVLVQAAPLVAAGVLSIVGVTSAVGKLITGWLFDRIDARAIASLCLAMPAVPLPAGMIVSCRPWPLVAGSNHEPLWCESKPLAGGLVFCAGVVLPSASVHGSVLGVSRVSVISPPAPLLVSVLNWYQSVPLLQSLKLRCAVPTCRPETPPLLNTPGSGIAIARSA